MATSTTAQQAMEYDPIDPTSCPTCRSGLQPVEPGYEDAVDPGY